MSKTKNALLLFFIVATCLPNNTILAQQTGLIADYPFNGNANDESGNGNDGTVNGPTLTADRFGSENSAYRFDGINDYISIPTPAPIMGIPIDQFTFQAWIKSTGGDGTTPQNVYEASTAATAVNNEVFFEANMPAPMRFGITGNSGADHNTSSQSLELNTWYQIVGTYDGSAQKLYVNGMLHDSLAWSDSFTITSDAILGRDNQGGQYFIGVIDDIRIYSRALSESEIDSLYHLGGWPSSVDYESQIQPIFNANCALSGCHVAGHITGLDLTQGNSYGLLVNVISTNYSPALRVEPYSADNSVLYNKVANTGVYGGQMPPSGSGLDQADLQLIANWINEGALSRGESPTISGEITYLGHEGNYPSGQIVIAVWKNPSDWPYPPEAPFDIPFGPPVNIPLNYQVELEADVYYIVAALDETSDGPFEAEARWGDDLTTGAIDLKTGSKSNINLELKPKGVPGGGFSFDFGATGGYAETDFQDLDGGPEITMEMFIKLHSSFGSEGSYELIHRENWGFLDYVGDTGEFRFSLVSIGEMTWQYSPNPGEWHHIAADYDGTNMTIYWDGNPKASLVTGGGNLPSNSNPLHFGEDFDGLADVIRISDVALYQGDNFDPWTQDYSPNTSTFLLYNCNEGSGNQLVDDSGNEHHAAITGNPTWDPEEPLGPSAGDFNLWFDVDGNNINLHWDQWVRGDFGRYDIIRNDQGIHSENDHTKTDYTDVQSDGVWTYRIEVIANSDGHVMAVSNDVVVNMAGGHVEGNISSNEAGSGRLFIGLFEPGNGGEEWDPNLQMDFTDITFPGSFFYEFDDPGIYDASGWNVRAFVDENGDNSPDGNEMQGQSGSFQVSGGNASGIDVDLPRPSGVPQIVGDVGGTIADENSDAVVNIQIIAEAGVKAAELYYIIGGDESSNKSMFQHVGGDNYQAVIPGEDVTNRGLLAVIRVEDNANQVVTSDTSEIRVRFNQIGILSTDPKRYVMLSVPGDLDDKNQMSVLDELGKYDKTKWRLFRWVGSDYTEYKGSARFQPGEAFWLITRNSENLTAGSGMSTQLMPAYPINLQKGWNQIGTPYNFGNDIGSLQYAAGSIEPAFYEYNGNGYRMANMMQPEQGYWLYAYEATSIRVRPRGPALAKTVTNGTVPSLQWSGEVTASVGNLRDHENIFAVASSASDSWDEYDRHEPPVIGDYVTLAFDNRAWDFRGGLYCRDVRSADSDGHQWPFVVRTNQKGIVELEFEWVESLPAQWEVFLVDKTLGIVHNLAEDRHYSLASNGTEMPGHFVLVAGAEWFAEEAIESYDAMPENYSLMQNIPNPFNAATTLRFSLPEQGHVRLAIYDVLGHEVITLLSNEQQNPGKHSVIWNGRDYLGRAAAAGVYLYRLTVTKDGVVKFNGARKLVLLK